MFEYFHKAFFSLYDAGYRGGLREAKVMEQVTS